MASHEEWEERAPRLDEVHLFIAFPLSVHAWAVRFHDMLTSLGCRVSVRHYRPSKMASDLEDVREQFDNVTKWLVIRSTADEFAAAEFRKTVSDLSFDGTVLVTGQDESGSRTSAEAIVMQSENKASKPTWSEIVDLIRTAEIGGVTSQFARLAEEADGQIGELLPEDHGTNLSEGRPAIKTAVSWIALEHLGRSHELAVSSTPYVACEIAERLTQFGLYYKALCYLEDFDRRVSGEGLDERAIGELDRCLQGENIDKCVQVRVCQLRGLVYRRTDELERAHRVFDRLVELGWNDPETSGILGANWMKRFERSEDLARQQDKPAGNREYLQESFDSYSKAFELVPTDTYVGINVATKSLFLGNAENAKKCARDVLELVKREREEDEAKVDKDYWKLATEAEAHLLLGGYPTAAGLYAAAVKVAKHDVESHRSTWLQAKRILHTLGASDDRRRQFERLFKSSWPRLEASREVRMAVVMYGGVSLAIYINGVAQELLNLVRSTAPSRSHPELALPDEKLFTTDQVYRKLARTLTESADSRGEEGAIGVRFVIDILSGTSAGGINAIFLAKALANSENLKLIKQLWIEDADMKRLVNDAGLSSQQKKSLLDSQYMLNRLIHAFKSTEGDQEGEALTCSSELDLFVTATDLNGLKVAVPLADKVVEEKRHRNVFRFRFNQLMSINDFAPEDSPFLAFAARCTSAFPFAFEPMRLDRLPNEDELQRDFPAVDPRRWRRFYCDYLDTDFDTTANTDRFPQRQFGDGGYLDNKPFSYAIEALSSRQTSTPVDRKLIYIEPAPKLDTKDKLTEFDVVQNSLAALIGLPRYETIREDLEEVNKRNERIRQVNHTLRNLEDDVVNWWDETAREIETDDSANEPDKQGWLDMGLDELIKRRGVSYGTYHRLKVVHLRDEIAAMISAAASFRRQSSQEQGVRRVVREWTDRKYREDSDSSGNDNRPLQNRLLFDLDLSYRIRRLRFVIGKCDQIMRDPDKYDDLLDRDRLPALRDDQFKNTVREAVRATRDKLNSVFLELDLLRQRLKERQAKALGWDAVLDNPLQPIITQSIDADTSQRLSAIVMAKDGAERKARLDGFLETHGQRIDDMANGLKQVLYGPLVHASAYCKRALRLNENDLTGDDLSAIETNVLKLIGNYYKCYEDYDQVTFPNLFQTELGEASEVDVVRFSPADVGLYEETEESRDDKRREQKTQTREQMAEAQLQKLAGTPYYAFAGFLKESWRGNDILWGRLHAAERIISTFLPSKPEECKKLLQEARDIIISEEAEFIRKEEVARKLKEVEQNSSGGKITRKAIDSIASLLGQEDHPILPTDKEKLRRYILNDFDVDRNLESRSTLRLIGRSTQVVGRILDGLSDTYRGTNKLGLWLSRVGKWFAGLVEVAIPGSILQLVFHRWLWLIYLFGLVLLLTSSTLLKNKEVSWFSLQLLLGTFAVHIAWLFVKDYIADRIRPRWLGCAIWTAKLALAAMLAGLTLVGGYVVWEYYIGPRVGDPKTLLNRIQLVGLGGGLLAASGIVSYSTLSSLLGSRDEEKRGVSLTVGSVLGAAGLSMLAVLLFAAVEVWGGAEWSHLDPRVFLPAWWSTPPFNAK